MSSNTDNNSDHRTGLKASGENTYNDTQLDNGSMVPYQNVDSIVKRFLVNAKLIDP
jgi:hypothetical protein